HFRYYLQLQYTLLYKLVVNYSFSKINTHTFRVAQPISCQKRLDVLAGRRLKKRSLLGVNEHFLDKPDDADDLLSQERTQFLVRRG
ncbi:MAG: hypothetical protein J6V05_00050, partial [Alistipes sp.]|nr:hypothetical protein [Alistipes sp.]